MAQTRWLLNSLGAEIVHPGEVLRRVYMEPFDVSQNQLARRLGVSPRCVNEIVHGKRAITARTALLLASIYGGDGMDWLERQALWDLDQARRALRRSRRPRRRKITELARRERVMKRAAREGDLRELDAEIEQLLRDRQVGAYAPGYGRAPPEAEEEGEHVSKTDHDEPRHE